MIVGSRQPVGRSISPTADLLGLYLGELSCKNHPWANEWAQTDEAGAEVNALLMGEARLVAETQRNSEKEAQITTGYNKVHVTSYTSFKTLGNGKCTYISFSSNFTIKPKHFTVAPNSPPSFSQLFTNGWLLPCKVLPFGATQVLVSCPRTQQTGMEWDLSRQPFRHWTTCSNSWTAVIPYWFMHLSAAALARCT